MLADDPPRRRFLTYADPNKVTITRRENGPGWLVTVWAMRTVRVDTHGQALEYARLAIERDVGWTTR